MLAKRLGARKVMALINKIAYAELVESGSIDVAISPQQITLGTLLAHVRRGDVVKVHSLRRGAAEAIEAVAHGNARESRVVGRLTTRSGCRAGHDQRDRARRRGADGVTTRRSRPTTT